jgi:hypothetical protein
MIADEIAELKTRLTRIAAQLDAIEVQIDDQSGPGPGFTALTLRERNLEAAAADLSNRIAKLQKAQRDEGSGA